MASSVFLDGVRNIRVLNETVRVECVSASVANGADGSAAEPEFVHEATLVMSLAGFIQMFNSMEALVRKLSESGAITDRRAGGSAGGDPAVSPGQQRRADA